MTKPSEHQPGSRANQGGKPPEQKKNRVRLLLIALLAVLVFAGSLLWVLKVVIPGVDSAANKIENTVEQAIAQFEEAQKEAKKRADWLSAEPRRALPDPHVLALPDAPLTDGKPLIEREGLDAFDHPRTYVDKVQLLARLRAKQYDSLTEFIEWAQTETENDIRRERWIYDSIEAFGASVESLAPLFDEWIEKHPQSFAPYLARAKYRLDLGHFYRGAHSAQDTSQKKFEAMRGQVELALKDLKHASQLRTDLCVDNALLIQAARMTGKAELRKDAVRDAIVHCPASYFVAYWEQRALVPRWGGSPEAMKQAAEAAIKRGPQNKRLEALRIIVDEDRAQQALVDGEPKKTLAILDRPAKQAPIFEVLNHRGKALYDLKRYDEALVALDQALEDGPQESNVLRDKANTLDKLDRHEEAVEAMILAKRLEPLLRNDRMYLVHILRRLIQPGHELFRTKKYAEAIVVYDAAIEKYPWFLEAHLWKAVGESHTISIDHGEKELRAMIEKYPHYFEAYQQLGRVLMRKDQFLPMVPLWKQYLTYYPDSPIGTFLLADSLYHGGKKAEGRHHLHTACALEYEKACEIAKSL